MRKNSERNRNVMSNFKRKEIFPGTHVGFNAAGGERLEGIGGGLGASRFLRPVQG